MEEFLNRLPVNYALIHAGESDWRIIDLGDKNMTAHTVGSTVNEAVRRFAEKSWRPYEIRFLEGGNGIWNRVGVFKAGYEIAEFVGDHATLDVSGLSRYPLHLNRTRGEFSAAHVEKNLVVKGE